MLLTIAVIVVVVLLAVALLPVRKREPEQLRQASPVAFLTPEPAQPVRQTTLRQQQLDEEANAVASEYQRRAELIAQLSRRLQELPGCGMHAAFALDRLHHYRAGLLAGGCPERGNIVIWDIDIAGPKWGEGFLILRLAGCGDRRNRRL